MFGIRDRRETRFKDDLCNFRGVSLNIELFGEHAETAKYGNGE